MLNLLDNCKGGDPEGLAKSNLESTLEPVKFLCLDTLDGIKHRVFNVV